ncbi:hypothetical protein L6164_036511 [Bauhinia variegata]|uniref:Uncharacterized protein n=1 Tax=Bauhinia variegata TaxID=167791 RepID=A0ACB9KI21_BAUVA|nr:hypothetical protein L6164_036511 [Bauhinia variegata]
MYVRLAASELGDLGSAGGSNKAKVVIGITAGAAIILLGVSIYILWKKKKLQIIWKSKTEQKQKEHSGKSDDLLLSGVKYTNSGEHSGERNMDDIDELPLFDFSTIKMATDNFSEANKLGEGGFGSVYRGRLLEGQEIAVKRLSKNSGQGVEQFKNEVKLLVKLQHRNLVRLYGCCIEMNEKMLVYEYMENNCLSSILFDKSKSPILDWQRRFGVLVLEIISDNKNRGFYYSNNELNLLGHAWTMWNSGSALELLDSSIGDSYSPAEVLRCIQVALLCVQELAEDRPTMSSVVLMLSSETAPMQQPKRPGFSVGRKPIEIDSSSSKQKSCSVNHVTITIVDPR